MELNSRLLIALAFTLFSVAAFAQTQPDPRVLLDQAGATADQVLTWDGSEWVPVSPKIDYVADSTAFRAYNGGANVIIMADRYRGGKFRKNPSATADQYMVFTDALGNKWERFDFGEYVYPEWFGAVPAGNATLPWKRVLRYAQNNPYKVMMQGQYTITDSVLIRKKVHIEGLNVRNQSGATSNISFNIPGNLSAIYFTPMSQSTHGPIIRNLHVQDGSASGSRHFIEFYGEITDQKYCTSTLIENTNAVNFDRYVVYANDCYLNTFILRNIHMTSCGGLVGVDMSGTKLVTQSQGDSWTIEDITTGGILPEVVGGDTAMIDVRDVGNVVMSNVVLQWGGGSTSRELIWADFGPVRITQLYIETPNSATAFGDFGRFGSADYSNSNCRVIIEGMECSMGPLVADKKFKAGGWTDIKINNLTFGDAVGADIVEKLPNSNVTVEYDNYMTLDRLPRVDKYGYGTKVDLNTFANKMAATYPNGGEIFKLGKDTLLGPIGIGDFSLGAGVLTQVIDPVKGKVYQIQTTGSRAFFVLDIDALPEYLKGKKITVSMTYKYSVSDSTGGVNRWALYNPFGSEYLSAATLQLNRWAVATDVFVWPVGTSTAQLVFGDTQNSFPSANATFLIQDITIRWGDELKPEESPQGPNQKHLIFRSNISGVNPSGFLEGDLVSTPAGLYIKQGSVFVAVGGAGAVTASNGLRVSTGTNVVRGSDSGTAANGSQLTANTFNHLNGFDDRWIGAGGDPYPVMTLKNNGEFYVGAKDYGSASNANSIVFDPANSNFFTMYQGGASYAGTFKTLLGAANVASASNTSALGTSNNLLDQYGIALGYGNTVGSNATGLGRGNNLGSGYGNIGIGLFNNFGTSTTSIGMGYDIDIAGDDGNVAIGNNVNITGSNGNITLGRSNFLTGSFANVQLGHSLYTTGNFGSINAGISNVISSAGQTSIMLGASNRGSGYRQMQMGYGGIAWNNQADNTYVPGDLLLSVNNGDLTGLTNATDTSRTLALKSNALTMLFNGSTQINNIPVTANKTRADVTPQAALEVVSTTQGVLIPRMTTAQIATWIAGFNGTTHVTGPAGSGDEKHSRQGEQVYNITTDQTGKAVWDGSAWAVDYGNIFRKVKISNSLLSSDGGFTGLTAAGISDSFLLNSNNEYLVLSGGTSFGPKRINMTLIPEFRDDGLRIKDDADGTKQLAFDVSGITSGATRTLTAPDASGTLALGTGAANQFARWNTTNTLEGVSANRITIDASDKMIIGAAASQRAFTTSPWNWTIPATIINANNDGTDGNVWSTQLAVGSIGTSMYSKDVVPTAAANNVLTSYSTYESAVGTVRNPLVGDFPFDMRVAVTRGVTSPYDPYDDGSFVSPMRVNITAVDGTTKNVSTNTEFRTRLSTDGQNLFGGGNLTLTLKPNLDLTLHGYPNSRDDAGTPTNFLSTDASGNIVSNPTSGLGGEATTVGNFQPTGTLKGLSISGTDIRLHTATTTTAGAVDTVAQAWKGQKEVQRTSTQVQSSFLATNTGTGGAAYAFKSNGVGLGHVYADESGSQSKIALAPNDLAEPTDYLVADGDVQKVIIQKGWRVPVRSVAGTTTVAASDYYLRLTTSTAATYTFTLPAGAIGDQFVLVNDGGAGVFLSVVGNGSDTVENLTSVTLGALGETKTFTKVSSTNWDAK